MKFIIPRFYIINNYNKVAAQIRSGRDVVCKPFKNHHTEQLKLVSSFDWIDFDRLADARELIAETLSPEGAWDYIDENRVSLIAEALDDRIDNLSQLAMAHRPAWSASVADDVEENIAADYSHGMEMKW